ncbi:hypothetical protein COBT_001020 [Conglomerata obtusa]
MNLFNQKKPTSAIDKESKTKEVLEHDFSADEKEFRPRNFPSILYIIISSALMTISIISTCLIYSEYAKVYNVSILDQEIAYILYIVGFYALNVLTIWFAVDIILCAIVLLRSRDKDCDTDFLLLTLLSSMSLIKVSFTLLIFSLLIGIINDLRKPQDVIASGENGNIENNSQGDAKGDAKSDAKGVENTDGKNNGDSPRRVLDKTMFEIKEKTLINFLRVISAIVFILLLKRILMQQITFNIHYKYYKDRIKENNTRIEYILRLNKLIGNKMNYDLRTWAEKVFDKMLRDERNELILDDFIYYIGEKDGPEMFSIFDENHNNSVTKEEFKSCFYGVYREKKILKASIHENDNALNKLNIVLSIVLIPIAALVAFAAIDKYSDFKSYIGGFLGIFLPATFIFGAVLSDMFQSIIFIFNVRPFDVGDFVSLNDKMYEVHEMGLLYSTFISDSRLHNFPNEMLRKTIVINLRQSKWVSFRTKYKFEINSYELKEEELKKEISVYLKENKKYYKQEFFLCGYRILKRQGIEIEVCLKINCPYQDFQFISVRKDKFTLWLNKTVNKLGIIYYDRKAMMKD